MTYLHALILGIIQALTEFFPVSSSAHLKIAKLLFHLEETQGVVLFDLSCHLGTLFAVLYFFRNEIKRIFMEDHHKLFLIFIALIPLIPGYFLLKPLREFLSQTKYLGICLMGTGFILFLGEKIRIKRTPSINLPKKIKDVMCIGIMQTAALIPGVSRSASTISCASILGWSKREAVRFSFLLSIPTIIGGNTLEIAKTIMFSKESVEVEFLGCVIAFLTSLLLGLVIIKVAMKILENFSLKPFGYYCIILGMFTLLLIGR